MAYHTYLTVIVPSLIAFVITLVGTRFLMSYLYGSGVTATDHNKPGKKRTLPSGVGLAAALGFGIGLLTYVFGVSFNFYIPPVSLVYLFGAILGVLFIALVGFLDDINVKREFVKSTDMMDTREGLKQWQKPLLTLMGAIPLMAVNAGVSVVRIPFVGPVAFGIFYPIIIIPLAVIFASNAFNLLGGFDGIATGSATIAAFGLLLYAAVYGSFTGQLLSAVLFATMVAFMIYNIYPAKMVPGDSFTYFAGTALVAVMILGNMESFGLIIFIPWIIEFVLHLRRKFKVTDLGKLQSNGTLKAPYGKKIYSWTHVAMNIMNAKEWQVSAFMWVVEILFVALAFGLKFLALL